MATPSRKFATFATYTPPPDEPPEANGQPATAPRNAWFPSSIPSYQSGGLPVFTTNNTTPAEINVGNETPENSNPWTTTFGWRVDALAAVAYLGGPLTALLLLILETQNDYVRFHAYQSAILTTPLVVIRIFASLVGFWSWLCTLMTLALISVCGFMAWQAYREAASGSLQYFHIPPIGEIAEGWLAQE